MLILMYHRVAIPRVDPWGLSVSPTRFEEHLQVVKERAVPLLLSQAMEGLRFGALPPRTVVMTFDDGYADNLDSAAPLLETYEVPATVFVCSGNVRDGRPFWWDELAGIVLESDSLAHQKGHAPFEYLQSVHGALQLLRPAERERELAALAGRVGVAKEAPDADADRVLSAGELRRLAASPFVEIGCHTVTHPVMPLLSLEDQREEIIAARNYLEDSVGRPITSLAYPYGAHDERTRGVVRDCGFAAAATAQAGVVNSETDALQLPRVKVDDWDGEEFDRVLMTYFGE